MTSTVRSLLTHFRQTPLLYWLSFLSGVCGIAYEIIYARVLSTYLGDMFYVSASILAVFLFMIGLGALIAHRFLKYLWLMEALIGVFAFAMAYMQTMPDQWVQWLAGEASGPYETLWLVFMLIGLPACLIGFSVPLFTLSIHAEEKNEGLKDSFRTVYLYYHLGAVLCVLLIEYLIFRYFGIGAALCVLGCVNMYIAVRLRPVLKDLQIPKQESAANVSFRAISVLVLASTASGMLQLWMLKLSQRVFGPYHENFTIVLVINLIGLAVGAFMLPRIAKQAAKLYRYVAFLLLVFCINLVGWIYLWSYSNMLADAVGLSWLLKLSWMIGFSAMPMIMLGATIPILLSLYPSNTQTPGRYLAIASFANVAGYLLSFLVLNTVLNDPQMIALIAAMVLLVGLTLQWPGLKDTLNYIFFFAGCVVLLMKAWPDDVLSLGYTNLVFGTYLQNEKRDYFYSEHYTRYDSHVDLVYTNNQSVKLNINGYSSLHIPLNRPALNQEVLYGAIPAIYTPKQSNALVLGLGIGATAYGAASLFEEVDVVEINPLMIDLQPRFKQVNHDVVSWPHVNVHYEDGLAFIAKKTKQYDAIINTVTSPLFFSSAKLYTSDFMRLAKKRLKPNGVYTLWFDARVTPKGQAIIQQTIKSVFAHCHFAHLNGAYTQAICSDAPLNPKPEYVLDARQSLIDTFNAEKMGISFDALVNYLILNEHDLYAKEWASRLNTYDLPALEYIMSARSTNQNNYAKDLFEELGAQFDQTIRGSLDEAKLAERCLAFLIVGGSDCDEKLAGDGAVPSRFVKLLIHYMPNDKSIISNLVDYLPKLEEAERWDDMVLIGRSVLNQPHDFYHKNQKKIVSYYVGALMRKGQPIEDVLVSLLYESGPADADLREFMADVESYRGNEEEAKAHAQAAALLRRDNE
ncbi:MAG: hypothetical protein MRY32_03345 [Rickettsiales bacterium]|nr:hypothetical protein [Rickettsiales bacterium]